MESLNRISTYFHGGVPATGLIQVLRTPTVGDTVTVDGVVYAYKNDFFGASPTEVAESLADCLAGVYGTPFSTNTNPIKSITAVPYGTAVRVISTVPGITGNTLALSTSNAQVFSLPATLSGGIDQPGSIAAVVTELEELNVSVGAPADAAATTDTGTFSIIAFIKRIATHLSSLIVEATGTNTRIDSANTKLDTIEISVDAATTAVNATTSAVDAATTAIGLVDTSVDAVVTALTNGTAVVTQATAGNLNATVVGSGDFSVIDKRSSTTSSGGVLTAATALAANANRIEFQVQNQGTNVLYIKFGSGASTVDYHFTLKPCDSAEDGTGMWLSNTGYTGIVTVAGTSPSYTAVERTP